MGRISQTTAAHNFRNANLAAQVAGGRDYLIRDMIVHVGPEEELRELSVAASRYDRYTVVDIGRSKVGFTLRLKRTATA